METIKEIFKQAWEKVQDLIKALTNNQPKKALPKGDRYTYKTENYEIVPQIEESATQYLGEIQNGTFEVGGLKLPIGSFEMDGNKINVKERVTITPDGKMYMRGQEICTNESIQEEIARQIKQNGKPSEVTVDGKGNVVKTESEKYRNDMYDDEARKKTEEVSANWEEKQEEKIQERNTVKNVESVER